jgi:hypothetical protein
VEARINDEFEILTGWQTDRESFLGCKKSEFQHEFQTSLAGKGGKMWTYPWTKGNKAIRLASKSITQPGTKGW